MTETVQVFTWKQVLFARKVLPKILPKVFSKFQNSLNWFSLGPETMAGFFISMLEFSTERSDKGKFAVLLFNCFSLRYEMYFFYSFKTWMLETN